MELLKQELIRVFIFVSMIKKEKGVVTVVAHPIEPGIKKYNGKISDHLSKVIKAAGLDYTPYVFNDGRILSVLPNNTVAFLYSSEEALYCVLRLD